MAPVWVTASGGGTAHSGTGSDAAPLKEPPPMTLQKWAQENERKASEVRASEASDKGERTRQQDFCEPDSGTVWESGRIEVGLRPRWGLQGETWYERLAGECAR